MSYPIIEDLNNSQMLVIFEKHLKIENDYEKRIVIDRLCHWIKDSEELEKALEENSNLKTEKEEIDEYIEELKKENYKLKNEDQK